MKLAKTEDILTTGFVIKSSDSNWLIFVVKSDCNWLLCSVRIVKLNYFWEGVCASTRGLSRHRNNRYKSAYSYLFSVKQFVSTKGWIYKGIRENIGDMICDRVRCAFYIYYFYWAK